ncbi:MAG: hypothetical protein ACTSUE_07590 [Promethearchaeota archaeon]
MQVSFAKPVVVEAILGWRFSFDGQHELQEFLDSQLDESEKEVLDAYEKFDVVFGTIAKLFNEQLLERHQSNNFVTYESHRCGHGETVFTFVDVGIHVGTTNADNDSLAPLNLQKIKEANVVLVPLLNNNFVKQYSSYVTYLKPNLYIKSEICLHCRHGFFNQLTAQVQEFIDQ